jgi:hypothetical protein
VRKCPGKFLRIPSRHPFFTYADLARSAVGLCPHSSEWVFEEVIAPNFVAADNPNRKSNGGTCATDTVGISTRIWKSSSLKTVYKGSLMCCAKSCHPNPENIECFVYI